MIYQVGLLLSLSLNIFLIYWTFQKKKQRSDIGEIQKAISDFEKFRGCLVEIKRVDPSDIFIWGSGR